MLLIFHDTVLYQSKELSIFIKYCINSTKNL